MSVLAPSKRRRSAGERPLFVLTLRPEPGCRRHSRTSQVSKSRPAFIPPALHRGRTPWFCRWEFINNQNLKDCQNEQS